MAEQTRPKVTTLEVENRVLPMLQSISYEHDKILEWLSTAMYCYHMDSVVLTGYEIFQQRYYFS